LTNKDKYRNLCRTEPAIPIFSRDWWLDAVCKTKWDVLLYEEKERIRAAIPLHLPLPKIVSMPPYTQTMGIWYAETAGDTKYTTALGRRQEITKALVEKLKNYTAFLQNFHYDTTDWLPFYWAGYRQTTRYTYLLHNIRQTEHLRENMNAHLRRNISKATKQHRLAVRQGVPANDFLHIHALTFRRQGLKPLHTGTLELLIRICRERKQGDIWGAYDDSGRLHAAAFVVWQESSAHYLAGGADPALRNSGAQALVLWEAIQAVSACTNLFDFEGSMLPGVERFFRGFGAVQTPYFTISKGKAGLWDKALIKLHQWL
jgi:hypothetical protein